MKHSRLFVQRSHSENVILSGPIPDLARSRQNSEESRLAVRTGLREAKHGDSSLIVRRSENWAVGPLRMTDGSFPVRALDAVGDRVALRVPFATVRRYAATLGNCPHQE